MKIFKAILTRKVYQTESNNLEPEEFEIFVSNENILDALGGIFAAKNKLGFEEVKGLALACELTET